MSPQTSLKERLSNENGEVRAAALAELLQAGSDVSPHIGEVAACITDPVETVRLLALQLLARAGAPAAEYFNLALSTQQTDGFRAASAAILAAMGPAAAGTVRSLCRCLTSADATLRSAAAVALAAVGSAAVPSLRLVLSMSDLNAVAAAVDALAMIGRPAEAVVSDVQSVAGRVPFPLQLACAAALCRLTGDPDRGLPILSRALEHPDPQVRKAASEKIALLGTSSHAAIPTLLQRTADADETVRAAAVLTLGRIRAPHDRILPDVTARLSDPAADVRYAAAVVLASYGAVARPAVPALRACFRDPVEKVAMCAAAAIEKIELGKP